MRAPWATVSSCPRVIAHYATRFDGAKAPPTFGIIPDGRDQQRWQLLCGQHGWRNADEDVVVVPATVTDPAPGLFEGGLETLPQRGPSGSLSGG